MKKFPILIIAFIAVSAVISPPSLRAEEVAENPPAAAAVATEPVIRVGISKTAAPLAINVTGAYIVYAGGLARGSLVSGENISLDFASGTYHVVTPGFEFWEKEPIRLAPADSAGTFVILNLERRLKKSGRVYNAYRGALEYRFSPRSKLPYLINELPLEQYLAGLAEAPNNSNFEYLQALVIAARSYAYVHLNPAPPSDRRLFDVFASTNDQLYLGYSFEQASPRLAEAALVTRGQLVTFNGAAVITPYFSHSNGQTKSWPGASRPWLRGVPAPYDKKYQRQLGHGYGISLHDAIQRAEKDNWTAEQILQYYYRGTEVEKMY